MDGSSLIINISHMRTLDLESKIVVEKEKQQVNESCRSGLIMPGQKRALDANRDLCKSEIEAVFQGSIRYATACDNLLGLLHCSKS